MVSPSKPQDMPPSGGYGPIQVERVPLKPFMKWRSALLVAVGMQAVGLVMLYFNTKRYEKMMLERKSIELAMTPFLLAERDRTVLKHLKAMREKEAELMKNHPGWEVGTLYGTRVYRANPNEVFNEPSMNEIFCHTTLPEAHEGFYMTHVL